MRGSHLIFRVVIVCCLAALPARPAARWGWRLDNAKHNPVQPV